MATERNVCPPDHRHAETGTCRRHHRCWCGPCLDRERENRARTYRFERKAFNLERKISPLGARRRLQALAYIGWNCSDIAKLSGVNRSHLNHIRAGRHATLLLSTHKAIAAAYKKASTVPKEGKSGNYMRTCAIRNGWASPAAWDDIDDPRARPKGVKQA